MNLRSTLIDTAVALAAASAGILAFQASGWYAAPMVAVGVAGLLLNARSAALFQQVSQLDAGRR